MILTALNQAGALAQVVVKKMDAANAVNLFTDRAQAFTDLFDPKKHDEAYRTIYADIQGVCARKGITPAVYWYDEEKKAGAPCISIPIGSLIDLLDAASR
jgi:hypothetical protein